MQTEQLPKLLTLLGCAIINSHHYKVIYCNRKLQSYVRSGGATGEWLRGEGLVWLIGAVVCSLAAAAGPIFTALHVMQTRYCDENSVCPSVCPSVRLSHA